MELSKDSEILKNFLLNNGLIKYKLSRTAEEIFKKIHKIFENSNENITLLSIKILERQKNKIMGSKFVSNNIRNFINNNESHQVIYKFKVGFRLIELRIFIFEKIDIKYINNLYNIISIIINFFSQLASDKCNKFLKIKLYLTNNKKIILKRGEILGPENVNSGFSLVGIKDGEITIYRKEE